MRLNISIPSYLTSYIDTYKNTKCIAWYVIKCVKYCKDNNVNIYEYYVGIDDDDRTKDIRSERKS